MTHDATQPTLPARHEGSLADRIRGLGLIDAAALAAFEASKDEAAPLAPTLRLTFELAERLRQRNILRLLESVPRRPSWGQSRAIYDPIAWEYLADLPEPGVLKRLVSQQLRDCTAATPSTEPLWLWQKLADAELEGYLAHLLRRHQMEISWVRSILERASPELIELSLAHRRAMAWAGVREGAAAFLRTRGDANQCVDAMVCEIRRQARWMLRHDTSATHWIPPSGWRQPVLLSLYLAHFPLGPRYWTEVPSMAALDRAVR